MATSDIGRASGTEEPDPCQGQEDQAGSADRGALAREWSENRPLGPDPRGDQAAGDAAWQERLLPFMVRVVAGLILFFFIASLLQIGYLHWHLQDEPPNVLTTVDSERSGAIEVSVAAWLESDLIQRRYRMTSTLMMAQLWIRYLGFVTGMIMAVIGAVFILGKLREAPSEMTAESAALRISIATASPGILLAVVGSALMLATIVTKQESWVMDAAIYMPGRSSTAVRSGTGMDERLREYQDGIAGAAEGGETASSDRTVQDRED